jgi:hypothetical protein
MNAGDDSVLGNIVADTADRRLPEMARAFLAVLGNQLRALKAQILEFDRRITAWHRSNATSKRLDAIPGVGPALATALVASIADPGAFRSGRDFSAWVGLVPKQNSSGGKDKLGSISKQGDRYFAQPVRGWRARRDPLCQDLWHPPSTLAHRIAGAATHQGCCYRARQQARKDGMGDDGQERKLQGACRSRGVNEVTAGHPGVT